MKAWKTLHYNRALAFLTALSGSPTNAPVAAEPVLASASRPVPPPEARPSPEPVESRPSTETDSVPTVTVLPPKPISTAPAPTPVKAPASVAATSVSSPAETPPPPIKITPKPSVGDRAPAEAGRFFSGIAWAGGEASFEAAAEADVKPAISIQPAPTAQDGTPPDRSNPLLAATRSALVTAAKSTANAAPVEASPPPASNSSASAATESTPPASSANAAGFFKNLNWKNNSTR